MNLTLVGPLPLGMVLVCYRCKVEYMTPRNPTVIYADREQVYTHYYCADCSNKLRSKS
jgi:DNA-directed RNA polymerase subunit RPC12/RpoP